MRNLKIDVRQVNGILSLKCRKQYRDVTNDVMFAYVRTKTNILLSALSIFFLSFFIILINLNTQGFVYLEFVKYQLGLHRNVQVFAQCMHICYTVVFVIHVQAFFLWRNKSYIFPMLG